MDCAIRTDDAMVSRHHARIYSQGHQYFVEDLGSANGIYFQEQRVSRHPLKHGDAVRCGSLWIRFVDTAHQSQPAYPMPSSPNNVPPISPHQPSHQAHVIPRSQLPGSGDPGVSARDKASIADKPAAANAREVRHLQRRVEQLKAELRIYRGGGDGARTYEELEEEIDNLSRERNELRRRVEELEAILAEDGANAKVIRAGAIAQTAAEIVSGLNDVLSNLRINVMAAEGEFDQFHDALPRASFELIREALRSSANDMETARDMLRKLRKIAGVS
jgi:prefoldin subunit 5